MQDIIIKSQGDRITVVLDEVIDFSIIEEMLRKKVSDARQFFEGATTNIAFKGRDLTRQQESRLLKIITTETTMKVTLVDDLPSKAAPRTTKRHVNAPKAIPTIPPTIGYKESATAYCHGGLRAGQSVKFGGSVVILGDVNPGSEVVAEGNVIILGALKGMAHAGASGDSSCFVSAQVMLPTQLRIANIITAIPPPKDKKEVPKPSIAYVKDGQVFVGPL